jgi:hypothetical protein
VVYASEVRSPWLLGISAALHNVPIAVVGLGAPGGWPWYSGGTPKLSASRRALHLLSSIVKRTPVALVDSFDTFIANRPAVGAALGKLSDEDSVLVGATIIRAVDSHRCASSLRTERAHAAGMLHAPPMGERSQEGHGQWSGCWRQC